MLDSTGPLLRAAGAMTLLVLCCTAALAAAATPASAPNAVPQQRPAPSESFTWPLAPPPAVLRPFEAPDTPFGPGHRGVDLLAEPGQAVLAAGPGRVVHAGAVAGRGVVSVQHRGGLRTTYEPVRPMVAEGEEVAAGQRLAALAPGHPGCDAPPGAWCLHWGARHGLQHEDPLALVRSGQVRLLPWIEEPRWARPAVRAAVQLAARGTR